MKVMKKSKDIQDFLMSSLVYHSTQFGNARLQVYLFIVIYLDWVGKLQHNMYFILAPGILK